MRLAASSASVRVPATSANLGPGYDSLGMALSLYDLVNVEATSGSVEVTVRGEGASTVGVGEDHLVVRAIRRALDAVGAPQVGMRLTCINRIPHGRGLGSSAAAVVSGIAVAKQLIAEPEALSASVMLQLANEMEGHPDNAAPAIYGGATVAWTDQSDVAHAEALSIMEDLSVTVCVPTMQLSTREARKLLPREVPHADAAYNAARAALLVKALAGRPERLLEATGDRLHQEYRAQGYPDSFDLVSVLRRQGMAATISGAGPSVLVLGASQRQVEPVVRDVEGGGVSFTVFGVDVDRHGARGATPTGHGQ